MRLICGVVGILGAALFAVTARALDLPPVPVPPLPTVTLPAPTPPIPTVPTPTVPAPTVPAPSVPTPTVPTTTTPASAAPPAPQPQSQPAPQSTTAPAATAAPPQASTPGHAAPPKRTARARHLERARILGHFRLKRAGRLIVTVRELAPVCRAIGHYRLAARRGANILKVPARLKKPGSYVFVGRAHGRKVFTIKARIGHGRRVLAGSTETVCSAPAAPAASVLSARMVAAAAPPSPQLHVRAASAQRVAPEPTLAASPILRAVSLQDAPASIRPFLFALLALAILFLATAAAPQRVLPAGRTAAVIARQRMYLAAAGIGLLVAVALATAVA